MNGRAAGSVPTLVNGEPVAYLPVSDRGLAYGDGVFETIRVTATGAVLYPEHIQRLAASCERLDIPLNVEEVHASVQRLLELVAGAGDSSFQKSSLQHTSFQSTSLQNGVIKLIVTRGDGGRGYMPPASAQPRIITQWFPLPADLVEPAERGIVCAVIDQPVSVNPALAGMKHLNRLDQVLASQVLQRLTAHRPQLQEVLMPSPAGWLIEGSRSNVFAVLEGQLCTPDLSQAGVAGVMRDRVLSAAEQGGQRSCVRDIGVAELKLASEVFICNSVFGIWPVKEIWSGSRAEIRLAGYSEWPLARWAQGLFEMCLANGRLSLVPDRDIQRPGSGS